jgi:hypothetical protein
LPGGVTFAIPPDARPGGGVSVDSAAGWFEGAGYRLTFDLGRFGERLDRLAKEAGVEVESREIGGRPAAEVAFAPSDEPFAWARVVQIDLGGGRTLTMRISCDTPDGCGVIERVAESVAIT